MTVNAMHPFFKMNIKLVHRQAVSLRLGAVERCFLGGRRVASAISFLLLCRQCDRRHERGGGITRNNLAAMVEQLAVPVFLVDGAKHPAMSVKIGELRVSCLWIELSKPGEKGGVRPVAARCGLIRVRHVRECEFLGRRILLMLGIHQLAVRFLVPPHKTRV